MRKRAIRVLLADDHAVIRDGLRAILESNAGIQVVGEAENGAQAVSAVAALGPDVVVMDISMAELNGIEATQIITQKHPDTRVIILSMLGTSEHIRHALQAGALGYLLKQSAGREVVGAVLAVSAGQRYLSQSVANIVTDEYIRQQEIVKEKSPLDQLSQREREILVFVVQGESSARIGQRLFLSTKTVETYRARLMKKLGVENLASLIKFAVKHGLADGPR